MRSIQRRRSKLFCDPGEGIPQDDCVPHARHPVVGDCPASGLGRDPRGRPGRVRGHVQGPEEGRPPVLCVHTQGWGRAGARRFGGGDPGAGLPAVRPRCQHGRAGGCQPLHAPGGEDRERTGPSLRFPIPIRIHSPAGGQPGDAAGSVHHRQVQEATGHRHPGNENRIRQIDSCRTRKKQKKIRSIRNAKVILASPARAGARHSEQQPTWEQSPCRAGPCHLFGEQM
mmetsp:Transcript_8890/g.22857  ORF Transcript_8890/g.22857 Transcript_8890/m.22857 type:complete len:227 (-) Transcript_8890:43-723(-)